MFARVADDIVDHCMRDVAKELEDINSDIVNHVYTAEFAKVPAGTGLDASHHDNCPSQGQGHLAMALPSSSPPHHTADFAVPRTIHTPPSEKNYEASDEDEA